MSPEEAEEVANVWDGREVERFGCSDHIQAMLAFRTENADLRAQVEALTRENEDSTKRNDALEHALRQDCGPDWKVAMRLGSEVSARQAAESQVAALKDRLAKVEGAAKRLVASSPMVMYTDIPMGGAEEKAGEKEVHEAWDAFESLVESLTPAPSAPEPKRVFTGPGHLEETGYIDPPAPEEVISALKDRLAKVSVSGTISNARYTPAPSAPEPNMVCRKLLGPCVCNQCAPSSEKPAQTEKPI